MKPFQKFAAISIAALSFASFDATAAIDPAATEVLLRVSCSDGAGGTLNDCFEDTTTLVSWLRTTRKPNAESPLAVNIGAGEFFSINLSAQSKRCDPASNYTGYISFIGSGTDKTTFTAQPGITATNCTNLSFSNLTIGPSTVGYGSYIVWSGGGSSNWYNVVVDGLSRIWSEGCGATKGKHYWFGSRLKMTTAATIADGYDAACDESWFFGSEIQADLCQPNGIGTANNFLIKATGLGEVHVYGSVIRTSATCSIGSMTPILAQSGGSIHIHGTGIDVISTAANNITVLSAVTGGEIHANGAAYNLSTAAGNTVTRIANNGGHIHAPYLWEHIPDSATTPNFTSADGADQAIVTSTNGYPHPTVYSTKCATETSNTMKWFDTVDKVCVGP